MSRQAGGAVGHVSDRREVLEAAPAHVSAVLLAGGDPDADLYPGSVGRSVPHRIEQLGCRRHCFARVVTAAQSRHEQAHDLVARDLAQDPFLLQEHPRRDVIEAVQKGRDFAWRQRSSEARVTADIG